jgi:hypothetical protein
LRKSRDYADKPFQLAVDKAIDNFAREQIINCDCENVSAGLLTSAYQRQCKAAENNLWQEIKDTGHLNGRCDSVASGPNARPNDQPTPAPTARITVSPPSVSPSVSPPPPSPRDEITLSVYPAEPLAGTPVMFSISGSFERSGKMYRFNFGDLTSSQTWQMTGSATHTYRSPGAFKVQVEMAHRDGSEIYVDSSDSLVVVVKPNGLGTIPQLVGKTEADVRSMFNPKMEFALGGVSYKDDSAHPPGTVVEQSPAAGTSAPNGTKITIVVTRSPRAADSPLSSDASRQGPDTVFVIVPDVVGKSPADAQKLLKMAGLDSRRKAAENQGRGISMVVSQNPAPGSRVAKGSIVTITTSSK